MIFCCCNLCLSWTDLCTTLRLQCKLKMFTFFKSCLPLKKSVESFEFWVDMRHFHSLEIYIHFKEIFWCDVNLGIRTLHFSKLVREKQIKVMWSSLSMQKCKNVPFIYDQSSLLAESPFLGYCILSSISGMAVLQRHDGRHLAFNSFHAESLKSVKNKKKKNESKWQNIGVWNCKYDVIKLH